MNKKMLIIDDDDSFVFNCVKTLGSNHISLSTADSPDNARMMLSFNHFDYILLNTRIPGGKTHTLKRELMQISPQSKFLFMTNIDSDYNETTDMGEKCLRKQNLFQTVAANGIF